MITIAVAGATGRMGRMILNAASKDGGVKITPQEWGKASIVKRLASWIAYGAVRLFLGIIGHKQEH